GSGAPLIERAADRAIAQIAEWADIPDLAERIVVRHTIGPTDFARDYNSWLGGMLGPAHTLRQSAMFRTQNVSRTVDGLYFAGATTAPGVGVPMCLISAELVLKHIRGDSSPGPLPAGDVV
ncbi:phytoene desaturase, partial [Burkholderia multivorans]